MSKYTFNNRIANLNITEDFEVAVDEAFGIIEGRFPDGTFVLPYGDAVGVEWKPEMFYKAAHILTFDQYGNPDSDDIMAYSVVSYASYGEKDRNNPLHITRTKESKSSHKMVPDADLISSEMPFRVEMVRTGKRMTKSGEEKDHAKLRIRQMQVLKVIGHKYVLMAEYDADGNVVMEPATDAHGAPIYLENGEPKMVCKLRAKQKPIFATIPVNKLPKALREALTTEEVLNRFKYDEAGAK